MAATRIMGEIAANSDGTSLTANSGGTSLTAGTTWSPLAITSLSSTSSSSQNPWSSTPDDFNDGVLRYRPAGHDQVTLCPRNSRPEQRIPDIDGDCSSNDESEILDSSSDESFIGQSGVVVSSSLDEDHTVVFAPLEVGDPSAGLSREVDCHRPVLAAGGSPEVIGGRSPIIDDARMDH